MPEQDILLKLNDHDHEIGSLKHRMEEVEEKQESNNRLTISVNELALNMKYMVEEMKEQGSKIKKLETEPVESAKYYKRLIISAIITTAIGIIIGAFLSKVF
jgi:chemotaxis receptor (MCP) glutamine deamidase CheD